MPNRLIARQNDFNALCERIKAEGIVAFDTEFVAESYYRPRLCLLQFGIGDEQFGVDPFMVRDLTPWWEIMADDETTVIVHGGREEIRFCHAITRQAPQKLIDVQVAEGLRSRGFPLSYQNLIGRVLGATVHGKETRSDWERRPLHSSQIDYALEDVEHLLDVWERQRQSLTDAGRLDWAFAEFQRFVDDIVADEDRDGWDRLPGYGRLRPREMALAQALFIWRDTEARKLDKPPRQILRDDLLVDIARRQPKSVRELNMTRGMTRRNYQRIAADLVSVVQETQQIPDDQLPSRPAPGRQYPSQDDVLSRILALALANRCNKLGLSMSLVGTTADLKDLVHWYVFDSQQGERPKLMQGWRNEVCGQLLTDVLDGKVTLRVADPQSEDPLDFDH